jgi:hypothetical protein
MEQAVVSGPADQAVFVGFIVFLVHARLRFGDAQYIDTEPEVVGEFLEAVMPRTKTSGRAGRRKRLLRVAAQAVGVSGKPWAAAWLAARAAEGLSASKDAPFMPSLRSDGWGPSAMSNTEATEALRAVLVRGGVREQDVDSVGMHSCKTTLLAWAAKAGLQLAVRKLLGYHTSSADETAVLYSRDAMAGPLRELSGLLKAVRDHAFCPDVGRSGWWWTPEGSSATEPQQGPSESNPSPEAEREGQPPERAESVCSSSDDSGASDRHVEDVLAGDDVLQALARRQAVTPREVRPGRLVMHCRWGTFHRERPEGGRLWCGRPLGEDHLEVESPPAFLSPSCRTCFGRLVDRSPSDSEDI